MKRKKNQRNPSTFFSLYLVVHCWCWLPRSRSQDHSTIFILHPFGSSSSLDFIIMPSSNRSSQQRLFFFLRLSSAEAPERWYSWETDCYRGLGLETRPRKVPSAAVSWCWRTTLVPCSGSHNKNPAITILIIIIVPSGGTPHRGLLKKGESAGNRTDGKWKVEDHEESQELSWCTTSSSSEERRGLTLMKTRSRRKKRSSTGKPNMPNGNNKNGAQSI